MNTRTLLAALSLVCSWVLGANAQGTAFTYQGRLLVNGNPTNGTYDLRFTLYDAATGGNLAAGPLTNAATAVSSGMFTVTLDFGGGAAFPGANRWLEIGVRTNGSTAAYSTLSPRQALTPTPYAILAANVADASVTAAKLSSGAGSSGQVLKMSGGALAWGADLNSGGTVTSVGTSSGLLGGPITTAGTLSLDLTIVPRLGAANTFSVGPQILLSGSTTAKGLVVRGAAGQAVNLQEWQTSTGASLASVSAAGVFSGSGAGLAALNAANITGGTLAVANGGSGQSTYAAGDLLYAPAANTLARLPVGSAGQVLAVSNSLPLWGPANNHDHFDQAWSGAADTDGLSVQNTAPVDGASALTGLGAATTNLNYGVFGQSSSTNGIGVQGLAFAGSGVTTGVAGESDSPLGTGVYGFAGATSGIPVGVYGQVGAPNGYGFYTPNQMYVGDAAYIYGPLSVGTTNRVVNLNADMVDGLNATQFLRSDISSTQRVGNLTFAPGARILADVGSTNTPALAFSASPASGLFSPGTDTAALATAGTERMRIASDGKVGVGRVATTNVFEVEGNASKTVAGSWLANSDARIKTNVRGVRDALATLEQVRPVSFHYTEQYRAAHPCIPDKQYYNVIAQEFAKVFPEAVQESGETLEGKPILQVDLQPAIIHSLAAIKELHGLVQAKEAELDHLKQQNAALESRLSALEKLVSLGLGRTGPQPGAPASDRIMAGQNHKDRNDPLLGAPASPPASLANDAASPQRPVPTIQAVETQSR